MTTFWLLGEEGSEEGETLKEEEEEEEVEEAEEVEEEKVEVFEVEEVEEEEETCALVTYTVSDHDTEHLMLNGDQNDFERREDENLERGKKGNSTKAISEEELEKSLNNPTKI